MSPELRIEVLDLSEVEARRGALARVFAHELDGLVVREFVDPAGLGLRLEAMFVGAEPVVPGSTIRMVGRPLQWTPPERERMRKAELDLRGACEELFGPKLDFIAHAHWVISTLMDLPLRVAGIGLGGQSYCPMTLRFIPPGSCVGPHHELEQLSFPPYADLRETIDTRTLLSFYVSLVMPERGGELNVYGLEFGERGSEELHDGVGERSLLLGRYPPLRLALDPGDLVIFDSGRLAHQVTTVEGEVTRCTIGGLLAQSRDGAELLTWS